MLDVIERAPLLAAYGAEHVGPPGRARELIANAPAVDATPVVCCNNCVFGIPEDGGVTCLESADVEGEFVSGFTAWHSPDFFCAYGKKREGG